MRMPGLDLLRAIAIAWTLSFHSFLVGGFSEDWQWLSRYGWMGVDLFFVLSGYLIGGQVLAPLARGEPVRFGDFYLRRAFRILPAYWTVLALYLLWPGFREALGMEPWWKFAGFFMNLSIDYGEHQAFSHAWSLCVEEHFYLLFPLLAWWMARRPSLARFAAACAIVVVGGIALRSAAWLHFDALDPDRAWFVEDIYYPTWNRLDGLLAGVMLAAWRAYRPAAWARVQAHANGVLVLGLLAMALAFWLFRDRVGLLGNSIGWPVSALGLALLVFAGAERNSWIGRWRMPGAGWLAAVSFSLYLVHKPVFVLVDKAIGARLDALPGIVSVVAFGGASVLAAALLHYAVERPFLQLRGRMLFRERGRPGLAEAA